MSSGNEAHGPEDLEDGHLGLDVLRGQTLADDVDPRGMGQHVRSTRLEKKNRQRKLKKEATNPLKSGLKAGHSFISGQHQVELII